MKLNVDIDEIRVASPCTARWSDMAGNERARFCAHCTKNVFNLSALTRAEIQILVQEKEGKFCGRFFRRADGTMLTADCPSRLRKLRERAAKIGGALCAMLLSLTGCSSKREDHTLGNIRVVMGDVAMPTICATNQSVEIVGQLSPSVEAPTNLPAVVGEIAIKAVTNSTPNQNPK